MVAVLADVDRGPEDKVLVLLCLTPSGRRCAREGVGPLGGADQPRETRKFAAHALGMGIRRRGQRWPRWTSGPGRAEAAMGVGSFHPDRGGPAAFGESAKATQSGIRWCWACRALVRVSWRYTRTL